MFEWLIESLKSLGYTIGKMEISRLHSSCRFVFFLSVERAYENNDAVHLWL
jgi:hypothetical protein